MTVATTSLVPSIPAQPRADRIGQGTAVEQARAIAEVEASIVVAKRHPRNIDRAVDEAMRSCARASLAEKAFFRFSRGEGPISGPSVQLARELARCWGNFHSGLVELRRDDQYRQSEMQAFACDLETNTRNSTTFIVPHIRDTKKGPKDLTDMRDIYENNANMGARRLREMIFDTLPGWYTEDAEQACYQTLAGDLADLPQRRDKCLQLFNELGITAKQLTRKLGSPPTAWSPGDLATLTVIYRSMQRGEINKDEEFEPDGLTGADILRGPAPATPAPPEEAGPPPAPPEPEPDIPLPPDPDGGVSAALATRLAEPSVRPLEVEDTPGSVTREQINGLWEIGHTKLGFTKDDKATFRQACETITGRKLIGGTTGNLSSNEAEMLHAVLEPLADRSALLELLAKLARDRAQASEDEQ